MGPYQNDFVAKLVLEDRAIPILLELTASQQTISSLKKKKTHTQQKTKQTLNIVLDRVTIAITLAGNTS